MKKTDNSAINKTEKIASGNDFINQEKQREQNAENNYNNNLKRKNTNGERKKYNGFIGAIVALSVAVLILLGALSFTMFTPLDEYMTSSTKEQQSFYDLVGYVDNIEINLSKTVVSKDNEKRQKLLSDIRVESSLATENVSKMTIQDQDKYYTTKFINQIGDFSKYLLEKLIDGKELTETDIKTLKQMHEIVSKLKLSLSELANSIDENYDFKSLYEGDDGDIIISKFKDLENQAVSYPHMIYDGAFSDGTDGKVAKYINDLEEISKMQAQEKFKNYFSSYNLKNVELIGETNGKVIETYNLEATDEDGVTINAQISKKGGMLVLFNYFKECNDDNIDLAKAKELAEQFVNQVGYKDMKAVWMANSGNTVTVNFASVHNGVICYPDLVKVNVCRERGVVSGIEASSYIYNYQERKVETATVKLSDAKEKVSSEINVESSRLAIIPKGESEEVLAYEFTGTSNGSTYYVYIDAKTGKEVDIFKVIETTEGLLLM